MRDSGKTTVGDTNSGRPGNAVGIIQAEPADRGDVGASIDIDRIKRLAKTVNRTLNRSVLPNTGARADLDEVVEALLSFQDQIMELATLLHLLHNLLDALAPFRASLVPSPQRCLSETEHKALQETWRPCQERLDRLADFAERIQYIGEPFQQTGSEMHGAEWAVETVALGLLLEDTLNDNNLSPADLHELTESLAAAIHRHLALLDRRLITITGRVQHLSVSMLGPVP
jgi:hypothetical protein